MPPRIGATPTTPRTQPARPAATTPTPAAPARTGSTGWVNGAGGARKPPVLGPMTATIVEAKVVDTGAATKVPAQIAGVPVKEARTQTFTGLTGHKPLMHASTDVRFGKLTQPQFDALKAEFGGQSKVPFDANRSYSAIDFLPPSLQGLVNKDIDAPPAIELKGTASLREMGEGNFTIGLTPNCHGTAWEAMRAFQGQTNASHALFYGDAVTAGSAYDTPATFQTIGTAKPGEAPTFLDKLKPGDVLTFSEYVEGMGETNLLHSAVYAGGGLFFEKPDTEDDTYSETPYRLVTFDQVKAPIADFLQGEPSVTARHPTQPLPSGVTQFATSDEAALTKWAEKKGTALGKPLVLELEMGMGGGVRGMHASVLDTHKVTLGANGRGVIE